MASPAFPLSEFQVVSPRAQERHQGVSRDIVLWLDAAASRPRSTEPIWASLLTGERTVVDAFCDSSRAYVVLRRTQLRGQQTAALLPRYAEMLRRLLLGQSQKAISIDMSVTPSTVALSLSRCMARLGLACRAQNLPLGVALMGQAAYQVIELGDARASAYESEFERYDIVSMERPDVRLPTVLSSAERAVTRQVIEGIPHTDAAKSRGTSRRTIANQLSAIFRKLGVSGRFELMRSINAPAGPAGRQLEGKRQLFALAFGAGSD